MPARDRLEAFVAESNRIEGITGEPVEAEIREHEMFLKVDRLTVERVQDFVWLVTEGRADLRQRFGMDVIVGTHRPPHGGAGVKDELAELLWEIEEDLVRPYAAHVRYELLHPFMDGNGRSGRAIWAWQMKRDGLNPFSLPFLHRFYYQALDHAK